MMTKLLKTLCLLALIPVAAGAQLVQFDDQASFDAATGGCELTEDFEGFAADTPFNPEGVTVTVAMGTMGEVGTTFAFRNFVETPPFQFTDNNGTNHASCFTNAEEDVLTPGPNQGPPEDTAPGSSIEGIIPATTVRIVFDAPVSAFGADFSGAAGGEVLSLDAFDAADMLIGSVLISSNDIDPPQFLGFTSTVDVAAVALRSTNVNPGGAGEGLGMDNLCSVGAAPPPPPTPIIEVPTLSTWGFAILAVLLAAIGFFLATRRRQAQ